MRPASRPRPTRSARSFRTHKAYVDIVQDTEEADPGSRKVELEPRGDESQGIDQDGTDTTNNPTEQRRTRIHRLSALLADRIAKAQAGKSL